MIKNHEHNNSAIKFFVYIVGIEDQYRGDELETQLSSQNIPYKRVYSVDLRSADVDALGIDIPLVHAWNSRHLTPGEIGCLRSHQNAWKELLDDEFQWGIVIEDDARITEEFGKFVHILSEYKSNRPTIISTYWPYVITLKEFFSIRIKKHKRSLIKAYVPPYSTVCYAINRNAAQKHFKLPYLEITTSDWPLSAYLCNFYVTREKFVKHTEDISTIDDKRSTTQALKIQAGDRLVKTSIERRLISFLRNYKNIYGALRKNHFPGKNRIFLRKFVYNLYYLRIIQFALFFRIIQGTRITLPQHHVFSRSSIAFLRNFVRKFISYIVWRTKKLVSQRINSLYDNLQKRVWIFQNIRFRINRRFSRSSLKKNFYPDYVVRDKNLLELLSSRETPFGEGEVFDHDLSFTCVINIYKESEFEIFRAFNSVCGQLQKFDQVIVYNDGTSNPETKNALEKLIKANSGVAPSRVQFVSSTNTGIVGARNSAARICSSDWVLFLDADDFLLLDYLQNVRELLKKHPNVEIVYPWYAISKDQEEPWVGKSGPTDVSLLTKGNTIPHSSFIKLDFFNSIRGYSPTMSKIGAEDWEFWVRSSLNGARFMGLEKIGYVYHKGDESSRSSLTDHFEMERLEEISRQVMLFNSRFKS